MVGMLAGRAVIVRHERFAVSGADNEMSLECGCGFERGHEWGYEGNQVIEGATWADDAAWSWELSTERSI